jgi:translation initiation factor 3 subunit I
LFVGHERSLTQIKFNEEGDLLFSCSKDHIINVWFSHNGERLGTYNGHNGTVWTLDVDSACFPSSSLLAGVTSSFRSWAFANRPVAQSRFLVSGSADNEMRLWSVQTGKCLFVWEFPTAVKRVSFSDDDEQVVCITEQRMGHQGAIRIFNINRDNDGTQRAYQAAPFFPPP